MRSIGSLGKFGKTENVDNVYVANVNFSGTTNGARIKTWQVGSKTSYNETSRWKDIKCSVPVYVQNSSAGSASFTTSLFDFQGGRGLVTNVVFRDLQFHRAQNPIIIDQFYCPNHNCPIHVSCSFSCDPPQRVILHPETAKKFQNHIFVKFDKLNVMFLWLKINTSCSEIYGLHHRSIFESMHRSSDYVFIQLAFTVFSERRSEDTRRELHQGGGDDDQWCGYQLEVQRHCSLHRHCASARGPETCRSPW